MKVCGRCGKVEVEQWKRHWNNNHPGAERFELAHDEEPVDPWCDNWLAIRDARLWGMHIVFR